jgi:adenylate cyclase
MFADSVVLIGPFAAALQDAYITAADAYEPMNGVEIHANIVNAMVGGEYRQNFPDIPHKALVFAVLFLLFVGNTTPEADRRLVEAYAAGNVVAAARAQTAQRIIEDERGARLDNNAVVAVELPFAELRAVSAVGHINTFVPDPDGVVRYAFQYIDIPAELAAEAGISSIPSFDLALYRKYAAVWGLPEDPGVPEGVRHSWLIPFAGKPDDFSDGFSVWHVLNGELDPIMFADNIVLIGPFASGLMQDA